MLIVSGCNVNLSPSNPDGSNPPTLGSNVSPGDSTNGEGVAPASTADSQQASVTISAKPVFCCNPLSIDFDAVLVDPADQTRVSRYSWNFGDGFAAVGRTVNHTYGRPGTYTTEVVATRADGLSVLADITLSVGPDEPTPPDDPATPTNPPPTPDGSTPSGTPPADATAGPRADAGVDRTVNEGDVVLLDGAASRGRGTVALSYAWRQLSGPSVRLRTPNAVQATFVAPTGHAGGYVLVFELVVWEGRISSGDSIQITAVTPVIVTPPIDPALPSKETVTAWLAELPSLPKVHYSFPIPDAMLLTPADPLLYQYVRVSRAVSVGGSWATERHLDAAVALCQRANGEGEAIPASIAIVYSPWHVVFPPDLPPTYTGPEADAEIQTYRDRLTYIRQTLASINASRGTQVAVTAMLLDTERFAVKPATESGAAEWNTALDAKYTPFYDIAREIFPSARIEWFDRGIRAILESSSTTTWRESPYFTFHEPGDTFSCSLYSLPESDTMHQVFRRTYDFANARGTSSVTPWVALGAGFRRQTGEYATWDTDWDYDAAFSLMLGREINIPAYGQQPDLYAPWGASEVVVFYPSPFDPRTPAWGKHFVAYARGAAGLNELP